MLPSHLGDNCVRDSAVGVRNQPAEPHMIRVDAKDPRNSLTPSK
jgi:hypothetical protein